MNPADWDLVRHPPTKNRSLRAFDAADQLALAEIGELPGRVLVVNDSFGGVVVPLVAAGVDVTVWSDSVLTETAIAANLERNALAPSRAVLVASDVKPEGRFDVVVVKVPKTLRFLHDQLVGVRETSTVRTRVIGAGMVKRIHTSTVEAFDTIIGPTVTSLATRKARLILPTFDPARDPERPTPVMYTTDDGVSVVNRPNVFSQEKLDIGTRFLLQHLPDVSDGSIVLDMGCGNGVVGTTLAARFDGGSVVFTDVSHAAVASASETWNSTRADDLRAEFHAVDLAAGVPDQSVDLVVINPPFHDQHVVGDETARRMFREARRVLRPEGELRVIGNRHLGYHQRLRSLFGNLETVASNPKFVVLSCRKRPRS